MFKYILFKVKPYIFEPEESKLITVDGNNVRLKCSLKYGHENTKNLTWIWKHDNDLIVSNNVKFIIDNSDEKNSILIIKKASFLDLGFYKCIISDGSNEIHHQSICLEVKSSLI